MRKITRKEHKRLLSVASKAPEMSSISQKRPMKVKVPVKKFSLASIIVASSGMTDPCVPRMTSFGAKYRVKKVSRNNLYNKI